MFVHLIFFSLTTSKIVNGPRGPRLCHSEPVEESLTISSASNDQRCLDFARHDKKLGCAIENTARSLAANFDVESETLHFLDQHVKRFRSARLERVITFHDRFVNPGAPL